MTSKLPYPREGKLYISKLSYTLVIFAIVFSFIMPAYHQADARCRGCGAAIGIIGGALILNELSKAKQRQQYREKRYYKKQHYYKKKHYKKPHYGYGYKKGLSKVSQDQKALKALGFYGGPINGAKTNEYKTAIEQYLASKNLAAVPVLSEYHRGLMLQEATLAETRAFLHEPFISSPIHRDRAKSMQAALKVLGFYHSKIDGSIGGGSKKAIREYQQSRLGIFPGTGSLSQDQISELIRQGQQTLDTKIAGINSAFTGQAPVKSASLATNQQQPTVQPQQQPQQRTSPVPNGNATRNFNNQLNSNTGNTNNAAQKTILQNFPPVEKVNPNAKVVRKHDVAVIIGNRNYRQGVPAVEFSHRDAERVKALLINDLGFDRDNIIDLRDQGLADMNAIFGTNGNPNGKLSRYLERNGKSNILVYYSGHGVPDLKTKKPYLAPIDADPDSISTTGYPLEQLYTNLRQLKAKTITVALDACFSGGSQNGQIIGTNASPVRLAAKMPQVTSKLTILAAASDTQLASWDTQNGHGVFTYHFVEGLKGKADSNSDRKITAKELHDYVDQKVDRFARRQLNRDQRPILNGNSRQIISYLQ